MPIVPEVSAASCSRRDTVIDTRPTSAITPPRPPWRSPSSKQASTAFVVSRLEIDHAIEVKPGLRDGGLAQILLCHAPEDAAARPLDDAGGEQSRRRAVGDLEDCMRDNRSKLSTNSDVAEAMVYMFKVWPAFIAFLDDGRICLPNNAAERALRGLALRRKSWLFAGSDGGSQRTAFMLSLISAAKLNDIAPQAWLANVLARIADIPQSQLHKLLPWNWRTAEDQCKAA